MRYCEISKQMSPLYFGLAVFCLFEARILEFNTNTLYTEHYVKFGDSSFKLAEYMYEVQNTTMTSLC